MKQKPGKHDRQFKLAIHEMKSREDLYYRMIEEIEDYAIILLDLNGYIQNWNRGAEKIKGYRPGEIIGKHFSAFYLPEDRENGLPDRLISEAKIVGRAAHEGWRIRNDGVSFWASTVLTTFHDESNQIIGFSKVTRDLTDKKSAEERMQAFTRELQVINADLKQSEERYHKMVDEVQEYAIIFLDSDGIIRNWNKGAEKIKQYKQSEAVGQHFRMFYLPEDRLGKLPEILLKQAVKHGRASHEGWRLRKDRTKFWGSITLTALHNEKGDLLGFSKVTRDFTEKKMAEEQLKNFTAELQLSNEALRTSEERYHRMIAEVKDYAIIMLDYNGQIQNWNEGAEKIKGYKAEEVVGKSFKIFYTEEDRHNELPELLLAKAREAGRAVHEGWRVTKTGSKFWGSIVITALHDDSGNVIGYSKVTRDLTDVKLRDDKLKEYIHELQQQNEQLDRFAYAASHDLQEPLRKVKTFADLIESAPDDTKAIQRYVGKIQSSADRMQSLIKGVLQYSRLSKNVANKVITDLNEVFAGVVGDLDLLIEESKAVVECEKLPVMQTIPQQMHQLFSNLLGNALKFSSKSPVITVSCAIVSSRKVKNWPQHLSPGRYYELIFHDNGIGFEQEYSELIFSLFQRLHHTDQYNGTGIGLGLCKKIVDNHDGYIYAEGFPGKGANFYVYLPVNQ